MVPSGLNWRLANLNGWVMRMTSRTPSSNSKVAMIEVAVNAYRAEDGVRFAGGTMNIEAAGNEAVDDMLDLGVRGPFLHYDDHEGPLFPSLHDVVAGL